MNEADCITIRGFIHLCLYLGSASDEEVRESGFGGLLRRRIKSFRVFAYYFLHKHVTQLLTEA